MLCACVYLAVALTPQPGWYVTAAGKNILVTYSAQGGNVAIDFDEPAMSSVSDDGTISLAGGKPLLAMKNVAYTVRELSFSNGEVKLSGTAFLPSRKKRLPGVVLIHGSGNSDRDGFWYIEHANYLASHGVAVLLPDKRGCGKSTGSWKDSDFADYAKDALAGVAALSQIPAVDRQRVGVLGLSQGGWVAPLAASRSSSVAFVGIVSGSVTTPAEQVNHEMRNTFLEGGLRDKDLGAAMAVQAAAERYIGDGNWEAYRSAREAALATPISKVIEGFPDAPGHWMWRWWRANGRFDPIPLLRRLRQPFLIAYGRKDEQDNVPVARSLELLKSVHGRKAVRVYEESGHAMGDPQTKRVSKRYLADLAKWISGTRP